MSDKSKEQSSIKVSKQIEQIVIPEELKPLLKDISEPKRSEIVKVLLDLSISHSSSFSGPLPHPEILKNYNQAIKNGAERVFSMAEKQSDHRINLENHAIKEELRQSSKGQIFGFISGIFGLCLAALLAYLGYEIIAGIFGTTTILGLVTTFVIGKRSQEKER